MDVNSVISYLKSSNKKTENTLINDFVNELLQLQNYTKVLLIRLKIS